jgi:hypothetical protein
LIEVINKPIRGGKNRGKSKFSVMYSYVEPDSFIEELELKKNHIILFYDSPESRDKLIYSYLADSIRKGNGVVYTRSPESEKE